MRASEYGAAGQRANRSEAANNTITTHNLPLISIFGSNFRWWATVSWLSWTSQGRPRSNSACFVDSGTAVSGFCSAGPIANCSCFWYSETLTLSSGNLYGSAEPDRVNDLS